MEKDYLTLKRASTSRPSGEWNDDDFDVLAEGVWSAARQQSPLGAKNEQERYVVL
jgi:hypothetical protein